MIFIGYLGCGDNTVTNRRVVVLDADCFLKSNDGSTIPDDWYVYYCKVAESLSNQGLTVIVMWNEDIKNYLIENHTEPICCLVPALELKDYWIDKLTKRYDSNPTDKTFSTLDYVKNHYTEDVNKLLDECNNGKYDYYKIVNDMNYKLDDVINYFLISIAL